MNPKISSLYAHFPFCHRVCPFCSFPVLKEQVEKHGEYVHLASRELEILDDEYRFDFSNVESVYFGGGTPSRLKPSDLHTWLSAIRQRLPDPQYPDYSIEINPEDVTSCYIVELQRIGFNRFSIGVQSFLDKNLKILRRYHTGEQSLKAIQVMRKSGVTDLNIDLMFGYPGQSMAELKSDLRQIIEFSPNHVSAYALTVEEKTVFFREPHWQNWISQNEEFIAEMYRQIVQTLKTAGFIQYEISNFSKPGKRSAYNLTTWNERNYLGIGLGAHSYVHPFRWSNPIKWKDYRELINSGSYKKPETEFIDQEKAIDESLLLGIRQTEGLDLSRFTQKFGIHYTEAWYRAVEKYQQKGFIERYGNRLRLTLEGMILCDEITCTLAAAL